MQFGRSPINLRDPFDNSPNKSPMMPGIARQKSGPIMLLGVANNAKSPPAKSAFSTLNRATLKDEEEEH